PAVWRFLVINGQAACRLSVGLDGICLRHQLRAARSRCRKPLSSIEFQALSRTTASSTRQDALLRPHVRFVASASRTVPAMNVVIDGIVSAIGPGVSTVGQRECTGPGAAIEASGTLR